LKQRCTNPKHKSYQTYGGRGISYSPTFDGANGFANFIAAVGRRPSNKHSIDRIDNEKGYFPGNIRWVLASVQGRNRNNNRMLTFQGKKQCLEDWANELGISRSLIRARIDRLGWSVEKALSTQLRKGA
jgi:hypothetical protein